MIRTRLGSMKASIILDFLLLEVFFKASFQAQRTGPCTANCLSLDQDTGPDIQEEFSFKINLF